MCICLFQFKFLSDYTSAIFKAQSLAQLTVELEEWMFGVNESKCRMLTTSLGGARSISALYLYIHDTHSRTYLRACNTRCNADRSD